MLINESCLPPGVILMILNEFKQQVEELNLRAIEIEREAKKSQELQEK